MATETVLKVSLFEKTPFYVLAFICLIDYLATCMPIFSLIGIFSKNGTVSFDQDLTLRSIGKVETLRSQKLDFQYTENENILRDKDLEDALPSPRIYHQIQHGILHRIR